MVEVLGQRRGGAVTAGDDCVRLGGEGSPTVVAVERDACSVWGEDLMTVAVDASSTEDPSWSPRFTVLAVRDSGELTPPAPLLLVLPPLLRMRSRSVAELLKLTV